MVGEPVDEFRRWPRQRAVMMATKGVGESRRPTGPGGVSSIAISSVAVLAIESGGRGAHRFCRVADAGMTLFRGRAQNASIIKVIDDRRIRSGVKCRCTTNPGPNLADNVAQGPLQVGGLGVSEQDQRLLVRL